MHVARTPVPFASDITEPARPIAIDGSRELIERGQHREAVFWIAVTYARCMTIVSHDAPALREAWAPGFRRLLHDLGVGTSVDLRGRAREALAIVPELRSRAEAIMRATLGTGS